MTPQEFKAKFPDALGKDEDSNLLDMACPHCGNRDVFKIAIETIAKVTDGDADAYGDQEWDGASFCICGRCDSGQAEAVHTVEYFTIAGLDEFLAAWRHAEEQEAE
jgi:sarcosine oxidase delta subunit